MCRGDVEHLTWTHDRSESLQSSQTFAETWLQTNSAPAGGHQQSCFWMTRTPSQSINIHESPPVVFCSFCRVGCKFISKVRFLLGRSTANRHSMNMFERSRRTPLYFESKNVYSIGFFTSLYLDFQAKLIMMLAFASVSNSIILRLNKHVHIRELTTSMATQEMLGTVGRDAVQSLDPIESSAPFWSCSLRGESVKLWICSFHLQPSRKKKNLCNGMLCNCIELIFNNPQQQDQICSLGSFGSNHTENFESRWLIGADRAGGIRPFDERLRGIRKSQHSWLHGDRGGTLGHCTLMENKEKWSTDYVIWCWYRLWMDGLNGLLRNSSWNINKIINLTSFPIQQEQYCYEWHHLNMFEMNRYNQSSKESEVRPLLSEDVGPLGRDPAHYLRRFDEATEDSTGGFT